MSDYHTREGYEKLYSMLLRESGQSQKNPLTLLLTSDYELLGQINIELVKQGCIPYSYDEISAIKKRIHKPTI